MPITLESLEARRMAASSVISATPRNHFTLTHRFSHQLRCFNWAFVGACVVSLILWAGIIFGSIAIIAALGEVIGGK
jgi:hypothetical protein